MRYRQVRCFAVEVRYGVYAGTEARRIAVTTAPAVEAGPETPAEVTEQNA